MALDLFDFDAVHIHNIKGQSLAPLEVLAGFDGPVLCSVHDLFLACPNFSLLYRKVEPCGIPDDLSFCARCLPETDGRSLDDLEAFRAVVSAGAPRIDRWVLPSQSAADYLQRAYELDPARVEIIEHGSVIRLGRRTKEPDEQLLRDEPLRVAFVGLGWSKKGLDANQLADAFGDPSVEMHHFGPLKEPAPPPTAHARPLRQRVPARPAAPRRHPGRAAPRSVRGDVRDRDERGAGRGHSGDRRELRRARRAHPRARRRMDDRSHRSGKSIRVGPSNAWTGRGDELLAAAGDFRQVLRPVPLETVADTAHRYAALYKGGSGEDQPASREIRRQAFALAWRRRARGPSLWINARAGAARVGGPLRTDAATLSSSPSGNSSMSSLAPTR